MTRVDQFESVFKAASKEVFQYAEVPIRKVLVVTDVERARAEELAGRIRGFLEALGGVEWVVVAGGDFHGVEALLELVERESPNLICTYRHLHSEAWRWPHALGEELAVLTQVTRHPVLVVPHPDSGRALDHALQNTDIVMAVTDHLTGDDRLINHALRFVRRGGRLLLTHIEDERTFERYMEVISKIPSIDTDTAREMIHDRLLREPRDFIASCRAVLEERKTPIEIEEIVTMGRRLRDYRELIESREVDLVVFNTKDEDQLAMHGMAYPLAVELRQVPLLML